MQDSFAEDPNRLNTASTMRTIPLIVIPKADVCTLLHQAHHLVQPPGAGRSTEARTDALDKKKGGCVGLRLVTPWSNEAALFYTISVTPYLLDCSG